MVTVTLVTILTNFPGTIQIPSSVTLVQAVKMLGGYSVWPHKNKSTTRRLLHPGVAQRDPLTNHVF